MPSTYHITNGRITPDSGTGSDSNEEEGMFDVFCVVCGENFDQCAYASRRWRHDVDAIATFEQNFLVPAHLHSRQHLHPHNTVSH
ncbi:hypothetical protein K440DRAFT_629590 [Wilcoxina mikolae CBS 423.85]|nr:hypothetical protein K440DRAFT_629590 [Wilcoxina mikolae CBS 423.85]